MNDLKSDLFPSLGCLRGNGALKGKELDRVGGSTWGRLFEDYFRGDASQQGSCISFIIANEEERGCCPFFFFS